MADNLTIKDGAGASQILAAKDVSSVFVPRHILVSEANAALIGQAAMAASIPVAIASNQSMLDVEGNVASGATDSGNPVKIGGVISTTLPSSGTTGQRRDVWMTQAGAIVIAGMSATGGDGANNGNIATPMFPNGQSFGWGTAPYRFNGTSWDRDRKPNATSRIASAAATTNATSAKASAGDLWTVHGYNAAASVRYLKFYNKASAPTVGTDVPTITLAIGPSQAFRFDLGGHYFSTGIAYALTTGSADADTGALTLADIVGLTISYA